MVSGGEDDVESLAPLKSEQETEEKPPTLRMRHSSFHVRRPRSARDLHARLHAGPLHERLLQISTTDIVLVARDLHLLTPTFVPASFILFYLPVRIPLSTSSLYTLASAFKLCVHLPCRRAHLHLDLACCATSGLHQRRVPNRVFTYALRHRHFQHPGSASSNSQEQLVPIWPPRKFSSVHASRL
eukprot:3393143-Pleurochrysis_carterae.AAC.4